jgi:hypothetical protein
MAKKQETLADAIARMEATDKARDAHWKSHAENERLDALHPGQCVRCTVGIVPMNRRSHRPKARLCNECRRSKEKYGAEGAKAVDRVAMYTIMDAARSVFTIRRVVSKQPLKETVEALKLAYTKACETRGCNQLVRAFDEGRITPIEMMARMVAAAVYRHVYRKGCSEGEYLCIAYVAASASHAWPNVGYLGKGAKQRMAALLLEACERLSKVCQWTLRAYLRRKNRVMVEQPGRLTRHWNHYNSNVVTASKVFHRLYGTAILYSFKDLLAAGLNEKDIHPGVRMKDALAFNQSLATSDSAQAI